MDFFDNECFDTNLYHVFRKVRDSLKTRTAIRLQNKDSLLDQFCVSPAGPTETIFLIVSYIPPSSSFDLHKAHVDNIAHLYQELKDGLYICVLGDFNPSSVVWALDVESSAMVPSSLHLPHEILVIDELISMGLV